jgi:hypothetical protein
VATGLGFHSLGRLEGAIRDNEPFLSYIKLSQMSVLVTKLTQVCRLVNISRLQFSVFYFANNTLKFCFSHMLLHTG